VSDPQRDVATALQDARLVDELHAFLWTDAFVNGATPDDGWSCRDHAVVVGQLLISLGADVSIRHGKCMFIQGPGSDGAPAVGIGQEGASRAGHTWVTTADIGDVDLSPKLAARQLPWRPVQSTGVVGSSWVAERAALFAMTTKLTEYEAEIARATDATDQLQAIYLTRREEPFTADIAQAGLSWANSRVSLRLLERGLPDDLYVRFAAHLLGLLSGERRPLRGVSRNRAWSVLAEDRDLAAHYAR
jgi:hypothetical protein